MQRSIETVIHWHIPPTNLLRSPREAERSVALRAEVFTTDLPVSN